MWRRGVNSDSKPFLLAPASLLFFFYGRVLHNMNWLFFSISPAFLHRKDPASHPLFSCFVYVPHHTPFSHTNAPSPPHSVLSCPSPFEFCPSSLVLYVFQKKAFVWPSHFNFFSADLDQHLLFWYGTFQSQTRVTQTFQFCDPSSRWIKQY